MLHQDVDREYFDNFWYHFHRAGEKPHFVSLCMFMLDEILINLKRNPNFVPESLAFSRDSTQFLLKTNNNKK